MQSIKFCSIERELGEEIQSVRKRGPTDVGGHGRKGVWFSGRRSFQVLGSSTIIKGDNVTRKVSSVRTRMSHEWIVFACAIRP
jgi:hypothetical protein